MKALKPVQLKENELIYTARDLGMLVYNETEKRIWEIEREPASIHMHPKTWEDIELSPAQPTEVTYNHFRGILVIRDPRIAYGQVAIQWRKPA